jgi:hypothetical protein
MLQVYITWDPRCFGSLAPASLELGSFTAADDIVGSTHGSLTQAFVAHLLRPLRCVALACRQTHPLRVPCRSPGHSTYR